jgi:CrcB protein
VSRSRRAGGRLGSLLAVAGGGAVGALARYGVALVLSTPPGTLAANVLGSLLLGAVTADAAALAAVPQRTRLAVGAGFLSSFTTYSAFALETATAAPSLAVGYVIATYLLGFAAALAGRTLAARAWGREGDG